MSPSTPLDRFSLSGRVALVTGGGTGIGKGIAEVLAAAGAAVAILGRRPEPLAETAAALAATGARVLAAPGDVRDPAAMQAAIATIERTLGPLDVLVNNAGGAFTEEYSAGPLLETGPEHFARALATNVVGSHVVARAVVPGMLDRGAGAVLNIASVSGRQGAPPIRGLGFHAAGKAGVIRLTSTMAAEWAPSVRVNAIAPGFVDTNRLRSGLPAERQAAGIAATTLGRAGNPHDIGLAALFLVSDASAWVTGVTLDVDGGMMGAGPAPRSD